jgi:hypothetical protein
MVDSSAPNFTAATPLSLPKVAEDTGSYEHPKNGSET